MDENSPNWVVVVMLTVAVSLGAMLLHWWQRKKGG
jgi:hypothetical protein